jgi:hypothetical protein
MRARAAIEIVVMRRRAFMRRIGERPASPYTGFNAENRGRLITMVDEKWAEFRL